MHLLGLTKREYVPRGKGGREAARARPHVMAGEGPSQLPRHGVKHIMKHTLGSENARIMSEDAVDAVQACASEFINLVVSEARQHVAREGRNAVTETDLLAVLSHLGFRGFHEPLKKYLQECEVADREAKRTKTTTTGEPDQAGGADCAVHQDDTTKRKHPAPKVPHALLEVVNELMSSSDPLP